MSQLETDKQASLAQLGVLQGEVGRLKAEGGAADGHAAGMGSQACSWTTALLAAARSSRSALGAYCAVDWHASDAASG